jgi:hypothetical protein
MNPIAALEELKEGKGRSVNRGIRGNSTKGNGFAADCRLYLAARRDVRGSRAF